MTFSDNYRKQVELLVQTLPVVAVEDCFALKGGTAINLFVRNLPRLSVDIDLTYLPVAARDVSLVAIDEALRRIGRRVRERNPGMTVTESAPGTQDTINKLVLRTRDRVQIKIEVTPVLRGCVYEPKLLPIVEKAEDEFGFAEINVISFADLYAGKLLAALDRQHPRDLFDVHDLFQEEGITSELRTAFIVYLISHNKPPQTLLAPKLKDIHHEYETNFVGMTKEPVSLDTLYNTRSRLIGDMLSNMCSATIRMTRNRTLYLGGDFAFPGPGNQKADPSISRCYSCSQPVVANWFSIKITSPDPRCREIPSYRA